MGKQRGNSIMIESHVAYIHAMKKRDFLLRSDKLKEFLVVKLLESGEPYDTMILGSLTKPVVQFNDVEDRHFHKLKIAYQGSINQYTQNHIFDTVILLYFGRSIINYTVGVLNRTNTLQWLTYPMTRVMFDNNEVFVEYCQ